MKKTSISTALVLALCVLTSALTGCGYIDRSVAGMTGSIQETCHDGVVYLQFTSGASVKYRADGKIATCAK